MNWSSKCMLHWIRTWLKGISAFHLCWLIKGIELTNNVYMYDDSLGSGFHPCNGELPWFVVLLLGAHSKKHLFGGTFPNWSLFNRHIASATNKLKWSFYFKDKSSVFMPKLKLKRQVRTFDGNSPVEVDWCCNKLRSELVSMYIHARSMFQVSRKSVVPRFVAVAKKWLEAHDFYAAVFRQRRYFRCFT